ncbi:hypothetical protein MUN82_09695 [Hymenobacter aerilatus]|uniref:protein-glutamate methylesterase n=1 Tax=Hymenobacter aerilatus TaxID=2932251 RepID=A0A8T9T303_9BACT|nr:chemotaxis protein CheB [Hymenobacter aerilatus]UOR07353.1 hypothetical protein MUN82_09695 [Hymenobacter aerilatus]
MSNFSTSISVLIGNLPPLVRAELVRLLGSEPAWQVVPVQPARGTVAAIARQYRVDLVIADESGMMELAELAQIHPVPVVLYSSFSLGGARLRQATRWNVHDYFGPWVPQDSPAYVRWRLRLLQQLRAVVLQAGPAPQVLPIARQPTSLPTGIVVLGGSTGGSAAVEKVVSQLLPSNCAILVAVHLPALFTQTLVDRLHRVTSLPVVSGETGTSLTAGKIIVVPGGGNTSIRRGTGSPWISWQTNFVAESNPNSTMPSIDLLMQSVVQTTGRPTLGVILSGLGNDGTEGARAIRQHGGRVVVQRDAAVTAMPQAALHAGCADKELLLRDIADYINQFALQARPGRRLVSSFSHAEQL